MFLREAFARALTGTGNFRMSTVETPASHPARHNLEKYKGCLVFWPLRNTADAVWLLLEALNAGLVPVLIPPHLPDAKRKALRSTCPGFCELAGNQIVCPADPVRADPKLFIVFQTSGSTGVPRFVAATEPALLTGVATMHQVQGLHEVASTAVLLPLHFAYAFVNQFLWAVHFERELILTSGLALPTALQELDLTRAGMICMVSQQVRTLATLGLATSVSLPHLMVVNVGGGPFPSDQFSLLRRLFPRSRIINNYGCTEALTRIASCEVTSHEHRVTHAGRPFPGLELRIAGLESLGPIEFHGPSVSVGLVRPDGSIDMHGDWIPSGDLGRIEDGVVYVLGRYDQIFKCGGERHSLVDIEQSLMALAAVTQAVAWSLRREGGDEHAWAVIFGQHQPALPELRRHLKRTLPPNAWPSQIFWADSWPSLPNGKTDRLSLQTLAESGNLPLLWMNPRCV